MDESKMDELLEGMATSLSVEKGMEMWYMGTLFINSLFAGNIYGEHARYSKHKNEGKAAEAQRIRREENLKRQKE